MSSLVRNGLLILIALLATYGWLNRAQSNDQSVFAPVPESIRSRLSDRLKLLVEYERTQQWDKEYDLLALRRTPSGHPPQLWQI